MLSINNVRRITNKILSKQTANKKSANDTHHCWTNAWIIRINLTKQVGKICYAFWSWWLFQTSLHVFLVISNIIAQKELHCAVPGALIVIVLRWMTNYAVFKNSNAPQSHTSLIPLSLRSCWVQSDFWLVLVKVNFSPHCLWLFSSKLYSGYL